MNSGGGKSVNSVVVKSEVKRYESVQSNINRLFKLFERVRDPQLSSSLKIYLQSIQGGSGSLFIGDKTLAIFYFAYYSLCQKGCPNMLVGAMLHYRMLTRRSRDTHMQAYTHTHTHINLTPCMFISVLIHTFVLLHKWFLE